MITFTSLRHDTVDSTIPIVFDRSKPEVVRLARECLQVLVEQGLKLGCVPYRLNINQQKYMINKRKTSWKFALAIKLSVDPARVLSPFRYEDNSDREHF